MYEPDRHYDFDHPEDHISEPDSDGEEDIHCQGCKPKVTAHCNMKHTPGDYEIAKDTKKQPGKGHNINKGDNDDPNKQASWFLSRVCVVFYEFSQQIYFSDL